MVLNIAMASILLTTISAYAINFEHSCDICCGEGEFLNLTMSLCEECPPNRYSDETRHNYTACKRCTVYAQDLRGIHHISQTLVCTRFHDTKILLCDEGFYIENRPDESRCRHCPLCPNNLPGCCSREELSAQPNIRTIPSPSQSVNKNSSSGPVYDSSLQVGSNHTSTQSPTTPTTVYLYCDTIRPEQCERAHSTHEKCFKGVQHISCEECPGCKTAVGSSSEASLSTKYVVLVSVLTVLLAVGVCVIVACCYLKNKKKKYEQANGNDNVDL